MFDTDRQMSLTPGAPGGSHAPTMSEAVVDVAGELRRRLPDVGIFRLHKLLYFAQGHHLAHVGRPLFRETVSVWDNGPVVGQLWHDEDRRGTPGPGEPVANEAALNTIGFVVSHYGHLTGRELGDLTHAQEPWQRADREREPQRSAPIQPGSMRAYFRRAAEEDARETGEVSLAPGSAPRLSVRVQPDAPIAPDSRAEIEVRLRRRAF